MNKNSKNQSRDPIIVIGLDGAEPSLIQKWSNEGYMPTITALRNRGCWGILNSTGDICSGSVWPSVITGLSPLKHGVFYGHRELKCGTYQIFKMYADQVKGTHFWQWLSRAGKRIAIFDVPHTYPLAGLNGIQIVSWGTFAPDWKISSWPPELVKEVVTCFDKHSLSEWYERMPETVEEYEDLYHKLISGVEKRGEISAYLLKKETWDIFLVVFSETHWAGHLLWHLVDDKHPFYKPNLPETIKNSVRNLYSAIDSTISKLIEVYSNATFLIFSQEGMGPNYSGNHLLPEILNRLSMGRPIENNRTSTPLSNLTQKISQLMPGKTMGSKVIRSVESLIPFKVIELAKKTIPHKIWDNWTRRLVYAGNDWRSSKAFIIPGEFSGAIRVNLKGREPNGLVEPGNEYNSLCDQLIEKLSSLVNVDTGKYAVKEVVRLDRLFQTENIENFPDVIVKWVGDIPIRELYSPHIGTVRGQSHEYEVRPGAHRPKGFLLASGKNICKGKTIDGGHIMDIAPTILYIMGQPVPRDLDGKVLTDIVKDEFKINTSIQYKD
jgi:predicted AlkP superfamily phosphohydrolase/phosphomutase